MRNHKLILSLATILLLASRSYAGPITPQILRGIGSFYNTSSGAIAFIPYAYTEAAAKKAVDFRLLPSSGAYNFRKQSSYWFIVNHTTSNTPEVTYLGVEILSIYREGIRPQTPVFLERNEKWVRERDPKFEGRTCVQKAFESKDIYDFMSFHKIQAELKTMDREFGFKWHATPERSKKRSWDNRVRWQLTTKITSDDFRNRFSPPISAKCKMMLNGLLLSYETSNKRISDKPLLFSFRGKDVTAAYVKVFSPDDPNFDGEFYLAFQ